MPKKYKVVQRQKLPTRAHFQHEILMYLYKIAGKMWGKATFFSYFAEKSGWHARARANDTHQRIPWFKTNLLVCGTPSGVVRNMVKIEFFPRWLQIFTK